MTRTGITRRGMLRKGAVGVAVAAVPLTAPGLAHAADRDSEETADIYQLQAAFHRAKSHQDIDLMVSLWAENSTFQIGTTTYTGREAVRAFFLASGSWQYQRISLVPSFKDIIKIHDNTAFLYFECHDVSLTDESPAVPAGTIVTHLFNAGTIRRTKHRWVFQHMVFGSAPLAVDTIYHP